MLSRHFTLEEIQQSSNVIKHDSFHVPPRPSYHDYHQRQYTTHTHQHPEAPRSSSFSYSSPRSSSSPTVARGMSSTTGRPTFDHTMHRQRASLALTSSPEYKVVAAVGAVSAPRTRRRRITPAGASQSTKRCQYPECDKISVSRGLCRGHGGGRRCQFDGCVKGAQSRSEFCWAHGGGKRCEVKGCMRSRKSKRFCVAHMNYEDSDSSSTTSPEHKAFIVRPQVSVQNPSVLKLSSTAVPPLPSNMRCTPLNSSNGIRSQFKLPSLHQILKKNKNKLEVTHVFAPISTSRATNY
jgi:hypothetical protein